jgi:hypothetical protein
MVNISLSGAAAAPMGPMGPFKLSLKLSLKLPKSCGRLLLIVVVKPPKFNELMLGKSL